MAQPTLPGLSGSFENGVVTLTWNCQYNAVKAISVLRSRDSINNYELIGYVKKTEKGIQSFEDIHPAEGKTYYKLAIVFNSGLTWRSNHLGILLPKNEHKAQEKDQPNETQEVAKTEKESDHLMVKNTTSDTCAKNTTVKPRLTISLTEDTSQSATHAPSPLSGGGRELLRPKIVLRSETQPDIGIPVYVRSRFIFTDSASEHIDMFLPDDVLTHHYSLKFYDPQNHLMFELQKINTPKIIFDRRNFPRKGIYRFVLRKDYTELEAGYILIEVKSQN